MASMPKIDNINREIALLGRNYERHRLEVKAVEEKRDAAKKAVVELMTRTGTGLVEYGRGASKVRVNLVTPTYDVWDEAGLHADMSPAQRRLAFDEMFNVNALPAAERRELNEKLRELMTPAQRRRATTFVLNVNKMSQAVQAGKLPQELVSKHYSEGKKASYPNVTLGGS